MLELCRCPNIYGPDCICIYVYVYVYVYIYVCVCVCVCVRVYYNLCVYFIIIVL